MGADVLITLLFGVLDRAQAISTLLQTVRAEGRDVSDAELDALMAEFDDANDELTQAIADARS